MSDPPPLPRILLAAPVNSVALEMLIRGWGTELDVVRETNAQKAAELAVSEDWRAVVVGLQPDGRTRALPPEWPQPDKVDPPITSGIGVMRYARTHREDVRLVAFVSPASNPGDELFAIAAHGWYGAEVLDLSNVAALKDVNIAGALRGTPDGTGRTPMLPAFDPEDDRGWALTSFLRAVEKPPKPNGKMIPALFWLRSVVAGTWKAPRIEQRLKMGVGDAGTPSDVTIKERMGTTTEEIQALAHELGVNIPVPPRYPTPRSRKGRREKNWWDHYLETFIFLSDRRTFLSHLDVDAAWAAVNST